MLKFIRFYFKNFLVEVLLLGFAATMLLVLVLIALSPDDTVFIGESCHPILYGEIVFTIFALYWPAREIVRKIKRR